MYLSEAKASHSRRMCAEVSALSLHLLHSGLTAQQVKVPPQGVVTIKQTSHSPGLSPIKGQKSSLGTQGGSRDHFSNLYMCVRKASPSRPVLVCQPAAKI